MKTLKDVAKIYKDQALTAINPGVPYNKYKKTGSSKHTRLVRCINLLHLRTEYKRCFKKIRRQVKYLLLLTSQHLITQSMFSMEHDI